MPALRRKPARRTHSVDCSADCRGSYLSAARRLRRLDCFSRDHDERVGARVPNERADARAGNGRPGNLCRRNAAATHTHATAVANADYSRDSLAYKARRAHNNADDCGRDANTCRNIPNGTAHRASEYDSV